MPTVTTPAHKKGDFFVDYEQKLFEDVTLTTEMMTALIDQFNDMIAGLVKDRFIHL